MNEILDLSLSRPSIHLVSFPGWLAGWMDGVSADVFEMICYRVHMCVRVHRSVCDVMITPAALVLGVARYVGYET